MEQFTSKHLGKYSEDTLTYYPDGTVQVKMENILTTDQVLFPGMLVLKAEGLSFDVCEVLEVWDSHGFLYVKIRENQTGRVLILSQRIGVDYFVWTLISYDFLDGRFGKKDYELDTEIEFDF